MALGIIVIGTFALIWLPFLLAGTDVAAQVVRRLFPFYRGAFEDKVANLWCSISPVVKLKSLPMEKTVLLRFFFSTSIFLFSFSFYFSFFSLSSAA
jgi:alpha-1,3-glucosyltransferase